MRLLQNTVQTVLAGLTAYTVGRAVAEEWKRERTPLDELKRAWEQDSPVTVLTAGAGLALVGWSWMKNRQLLVAAGAGVLVGSGLLEKTMARLGEPVKAAQLHSGPGGTTPSEARALKAWDGRDMGA